MYIRFDFKCKSNQKNVHKIYLLKDFGTLLFAPSLKWGKKFFTLFKLLQLPRISLLRGKKLYISTFIVNPVEKSLDKTLFGVAVWIQQGRECWTRCSTLATTTTKRFNSYIKRKSLFHFVAFFLRLPLREGNSCTGEYT